MLELHVPCKESVMVLDFGSQYTKLITRRIREQHVFGFIAPHGISAQEVAQLKPKGIIISGGPSSVYDKSAPHLDKKIFKLGIPILGICYGAQLIAKLFPGGAVRKAQEREYGKTELFLDDRQDLFFSLPGNLTCWMSHGDYIHKLPKGFVRIAHTLNSPLAAFANYKEKVYGVQFHPEVEHTQRGNQILGNFLFKVCHCYPRWTAESFIEDTIATIKKTVADKCVVCGLSGGVDSSVTALLIHRAIGRRLKCIFIDNGLLRKEEALHLMKTFSGHYKMNVTHVDASRRFLSKLKGIVDPEAKRKIIGEEFVRVFEDKASGFNRVEFLAQGTLYPDVIESTSGSGGPSSRIKTHHNVGGLPLKMKLKLLEPLRSLFKDEVRQIGKELGLPESIIYRQPFPGPGLAVRIIGEVTPERLKILRDVDERVAEEIVKAELYQTVWQSFAVLLPVKTVGVMGDKRSYEHVVAIRCVTSSDGMTADWFRIPYKVLETISHRVINEVKGVNRVVYDVSSKPPATIEWE